MGKTSYGGIPITIRGTSSEIDLPKEGIYEISFYIFMFTNITDMTLGNDYILISINSGLDPRQIIKMEKFDYLNIGKPNVWQKKSYVFNSSETKIIVKNYLNIF